MGRFCYKIILRKIKNMIKVKVKSIYFRITCSLQTINYEYIKGKREEKLC